MRITAFFLILMSSMAMTLGCAEPGGTGGGGAAAPAASEEADHSDAGGEEEMADEGAAE